jgi:hypothetical protein
VADFLSLFVRDFSSFYKAVRIIDPVRPPLSLFLFRSLCSVCNVMRYCNFFHKRLLNPFLMRTYSSDPHILISCFSVFDLLLNASNAV